MIKPLLCMIAIGAALGFMIPGGEAPAPAPAEAVAAPAERSDWPDPNPEETQLERRSNGHFYVTADVNGHPVEFVVDTGATMVALTEEDARRLGMDFHPREFTMIGRGASGDVRGKLVRLDVIDIDGKRVPRVSGAIVEDLDISLLGQSYLARITAVEMNGDHMVLR